MFGIKSKPAADRVAAAKALDAAIAAARRAGVDIVGVLESELASIRWREHNAAEQRRMGSPHVATNDAWAAAEIVRLKKEGLWP